MPNNDDYVLITGASSGIGLAIAREFAARGRRLILVGRNLPRLKAAAATLGPGTVTVCLTADLSRPGAGEKLYAACHKGRLKVGVLVNNAGAGLPALPQVRHSLKKTRGLFQLNCAAPLELATLFGREMARRGSGAILNVASTAAYQPMPGSALYGAGKAFLLSLSEAMHVELKRQGVTVTAVCPGVTDTNFFKHGRPRVPEWLYPFLSAEHVARKAVRALERGKASTIPAFRHWLIAQLPRLLPRRWMLALMRIIEKKRKGV